MFRFRYAETYEQRYGSAMDLEAKATSGRSVALCHLQVGLSSLGRLREHYKTHVRPCSFCSRFLV